MPPHSVPTITGDHSMKFEHKPHSRTLAILEGRVHPTKTHDQLPSGNAYARVNSWLAVKITQGVGSMTCAWLFCILAIIGLPAALAKGGEGPVAWIAQTFLQLVLLSIIIVGTNIQSAASDKRAQDTYADAEAVLHEAMQIQAHLEAQDKALTALVTKLGAVTD
jgi:hypothetical protein